MIKIICLGKIKEKYLNDLIDDYKKRITKYHKIEIIELKDTNDLSAEQIDIEKHIGNQDYVIAMDINGKELSSVEFADKINETFNHYGTITFIIGSSYGISEDLKNKAQFRLSFSKVTFPHALFRGILLEQIYRSFKIMNNESYHK